MLSAGDQFLVSAGAGGGPQGVGGVVAEGYGRLGKLDGVHGGRDGGVGDVDAHAQLVHALYHCHAELAEAAGVAFLLPVADVVLAVVGLRPASRTPAL